MFLRLYSVLFIIVTSCTSIYSAQELEIDTESLKLGSHLKEIASQIFLREKGKKSIEDFKMHTHSPNMVQEWKDYTQHSQTITEKANGEVFYNVKA